MFVLGAPCSLRQGDDVWEVKTVTSLSDGENGMNGQSEMFYNQQARY